MTGFPWTHEILAASAVSGGFLVVFVLAEILKRRTSAPVEVTRKFVHFFGGLLTLSFPWVFDSRWTVAGLSVVFGGLIWITKKAGSLQSVHGVERTSEGALFFPLGILTVFLLGYDRPTFYLVAVLALVVSDTVAALVGTEYGRRRFRVESDLRSLEGSLTFLVTTFLAAHLPLLLMEGLEAGASVLISLQIAIIVTQFELISLKGNDNLLVPVATFYLLIKMTPHGVGHQGEEVLAQLAIILIVGLLAWRFRVLSLAGANTLMLFLYAAWGLGGAEWIVGPGLAFSAFIILRAVFRAPTSARREQYQVVAVFYVCIIPTVILLANNSLETLIPWAPEGLKEGDPLYAPFIAIVAAQLAILSWTRVHLVRGGDWGWWKIAIWSVLGTFFLVVLPGLLAGRAGLERMTLLEGFLAPVVALSVYLLGLSGGP